MSTTPGIPRPSPINASKNGLINNNNNNNEKFSKNKNVYNTWDSQAVSDPSTNQAQPINNNNNNNEKFSKTKNVYNTWDSQAVSDPNRTRCRCFQRGMVVDIINYKNIYQIPIFSINALKILTIVPLTTHIGSASKNGLINNNNNNEKFSKTKNVYNTWDSQAVSDPSTNQAQRCLT
ncbi:hypothetical protein DINM_003253 [Dirofilaria immitis]|nr:hypothetical protein [Dirofilaria immitis]